MKRSPLFGNHTFGHFAFMTSPQNHPERISPFGMLFPNFGGLCVCGRGFQDISIESGYSEEVGRCAPPDLSCKLNDTLILEVWMLDNRPTFSDAASGWRVVPDFGITQVLFPRTLTFASSLYPKICRHDVGCFPCSAFCFEYCQCVP
jgi:hypothetical protein